MTDTLIVTRHPALVDFLIERGVIASTQVAEVKDHVTPMDVQDRHVIGVLPLHLAALARSVTEVPLNLPKELRGVELTLEQVRQYAGSVATYRVERQ